MSYKIYEIKSYSNWTNKRMNEEFESYELDELITILQNKNKGYHQRIDPLIPYQFFGDCDKFRGSFNDFSKILIDFMKKYYNIQISENQISYTENKSVNGSFHYSIPSLYCSCKKLKEIHTNLLEKNKDTFIYQLGNSIQKVIDTTIYSKHWFRLPNQLKEQKKDTEHIIKRGKMEDFILGYIPKNCICINDYKFIDVVNTIKVKNKSKKITKKINDSTDDNIKDIVLKDTSDSDSENNTKMKINKRGKFRELTKMEIKTLVNMLSEKRYNYEDWINLGMCLHNINDNYLDIWNNWSKKDKAKYKLNECKDKWTTFGGTFNNGLHIGSLLMWAKEDNLEVFNKFIEKKKILDLVDKYRDYFPDNQLEISNVITNETSHYVGLNDKYCPIAEEEHDSNQLYLEISPFEYVMKCHQCIGQKYPCNHIHLKERDLNQIFNMVHINNLHNLNVTINNINNTNENQLLDEYSYEFENVFEDIEFNKLIFKSLNQTHYDIAKVLFNVSKNKFMCTYNNEWYIFQNHRWIRDNEQIKDYISNNLVEYYDKINLFYINKREITKNEIDKKKYNIQITKVSNLIKQLKNTGFKTSIITEAFSIFNTYNRQKMFDFDASLDNNSYLIGFNNGIYDLTKMEFRNGSPEDYISMSVGYDYNPESSDNMHKVDQFFKDIQPEESERNYLLTFLSSLLEFNNPEEKFTIFSGKTRNGKTKLTDLISHTLGDYYGNIQSSMLTKERPSMDTPQPALINLNKKRIVSASEPEEEQSMNTGFIKGITGKDKFTSRYLYSNEMITFTLKFKLILLCNDKPKVNALNDHAFWNRCRCVEFPVTFVENPINEFQKKIDENLDEKMIHWKNDFFLLLLKYYKLYKEYGLKPTNKVLQYTNKYKNENDFYKEFADQYVVKDGKSFIVWTELKETFLDWFSENKGNKLPQTKQIKEYFEKNIFMEEEKHRTLNKNNYRGWFGWKINNEN